MPQSPKLRVRTCLMALAYLGLLGPAPRTLTSLGREWGVSREIVRQSVVRFRRWSWHRGQIHIASGFCFFLSVRVALG